MADWTERERSGDDWRQFYEWLKSTKGMSAALQFNFSYGFGDFTQTPEYQEWASLERPASPFRGTGIQGEPAPSLDYASFYKLASEDPNEFLRIITDPSGSELPDVTERGTKWEMSYPVGESARWGEVRVEEEEEEGVTTPGTRVDEYGNMYQQTFVDGELLGENYIGQVPEEGLPPGEMTDFQKAQVAQWGKDEAPTEQELYDMFELYRQQVISGMKGTESEWINMWFAEHMQNPATSKVPKLKQTQLSPEGYEKAQETGAARGDWQPVTRMETFQGGGYAEGLKKPPVSEEYWEAPVAWAGTYQTGKKDEKFGGVPTGELSEAGKANRIAYLREHKPLNPKYGPQTPAWMANYSPSAKTGEQLGIHKPTITTPSGQQWGQTPYSTREQLKGYMGYTGQSYQNMLDQIAMSSPEAPMGGKTKRWTPQRQV